MQKVRAAAKHLWQPAYEKVDDGDDEDGDDGDDNTQVELKTRNDAYNVSMSGPGQAAYNRMEEIRARVAVDQETVHRLLAKRAVQSALAFSEEEQHARNMIALLSIVPFAVSASLALLALLGMLEWVPRALFTRFGVLVVAPLPLAFFLGLLVSTNTSRFGLTLSTIFLALIELLVVYASVNVVWHIATATEAGALVATTSLIALVAAAFLLAMAAIAGGIMVWLVAGLRAAPRMRRPRGTRAH